MIRFFLFILCLSLALLSCADRKQRLTGSALVSAVRDYVNEKNAFIDFTGNRHEVEKAVFQILSENRNGKTGQDTIFLPCIDGKQRALGIHVPLSYSPDKPVPLVLWLHGGVNGTRQNKGEDAGNYFSRESDSLGFIFAAVSGERGATWFDDIGINNILSALAWIKRTYAVDDNRVILAGVSDGATGCYISGMHYPDPFAGYVVISGFPLMLQMMNIAYIPSNMALRQWHIVHTGQDRLYPGEQVKEVVEGFKGMGIPLTFDYYPNMPHGLDCMVKERPAVLDFIMIAHRNPCPDSMAFCTFEPMRVSWLSVDSLAVSRGGLSVSPPFISARAEGGTVSVETQGVVSFSIYAAAPLFAPDGSIRLVVNGRDRGVRTLQFDCAVMLENARMTLDKSFVPFCRLRVNTAEL